MGKYMEQSKWLREILDLNREVVGVKFLQDIEPDAWQDYEQTRKMRYCQAVMLAGEGQKSLLSAQNLACAAAGAAFGLMPLHPKLASGEGHFNTGIYGSLESSAKMMQEMPRLEQGAYRYVAVAPLGEIDWDPDVIVVEAPPEAIMWVSLASMYQSGQRLQFSTSVVQATCVDATVIPMLSGKPNASFGCTGCREATDLAFVEALFGLPGKDLELMIENLRMLSDKVIPKNRNKAVYKRFSATE